MDTTSEVLILRSWVVQGETPRRLFRVEKPMSDVHYTFEDLEELLTFLERHWGHASRPEDPPSE